MDKTFLSKKKNFGNLLLAWHNDHNDRSLPWKNETDPYRIWLSEIILQQTRAAQGLPYYLRFIEQYPTIADLAHADDNAVFKLWEGLGYYNRCRNMLATARKIAFEYNGVFPTSYQDIIALKGVGNYTAAAIASFAFGLHHAVVDGNVYRVLARYFGIETPFDTTAGKKEFADLAQELLTTGKSAAHNQAIMDLGATICTPQKPTCETCPLQQRCFARERKMENLLPVRSKNIIISTRYFNFLILTFEGKIWATQRTQKDIWQNLYEPFLIETDHLLNISEIKRHLSLTKHGIDYLHITEIGELKQRLTHRIIESRFFFVPLKTPFFDISNNGIWINGDKINSYAFPKTILNHFKEIDYF